MDQRSDDIRQDIESTRAALDQKLDTLETKARQTFDLKHQVSERPWMMLGAALATGYVLGSMGGDEPQQRWHGQPVTTTDYNQHVANQPPQRSQSSGESFLSQFDDEIEMLKSAAIATLTGFLRDSIRAYVPALGDQLSRMDRDRGVSGAGYRGDTGYAAGRTPSTAPNSSFSSGAGRTGFDSPAETTSYGPNWVARESSRAEQVYPPGSPGVPIPEEPDYVKTYHPPSEADRERTVGS